MLAIFIVKHSGMPSRCYGDGELEQYSNQITFTATTIYSDAHQRRQEEKSCKWNINIYILYLQTEMINFIIHLFTCVTHSYINVY